MAIPSILIEHSIFYTLRDYKDIELMILKGHLLLEILMSRIVPNKNLSFYGKAVSIQKLDGLGFISYSLLELNNIRNNLALDYKFELEQSGIIEWANEIINKIEYTKFSKHTKRIKIAHAFSALALKIFEYDINIDTI